MPAVALGTFEPVLLMREIARLHCAEELPLFKTIKEKKIAGFSGAQLIGINVPTEQLAEAMPLHPIFSRSPPNWRE